MNQYQSQAMIMRDTSSNDGGLVTNNSSMVELPDVNMLSMQLNPSSRLGANQSLRKEENKGLLTAPPKKLIQ